MCLRLNIGHCLLTCPMYCFEKSDTVVQPPIAAALKPYLKKSAYIYRVYIPVCPYLVVECAWGQNIKEKNVYYDDFYDGFKRDCDRKHDFSKTWVDMRSPFREASANQDAPQGPTPAPISDPQPIKTLLNASCFIYCCSLTYLYHLCAYIVDSP